MNEEAIKLEHVVKSYGDKKVLKGVDLSIKKGNIFGLVGKNGAGKTTIFKTILGLSNYEGKIYLNGKSQSYEKNNIGFFIGKNFFDDMTAEQNLDYYRILKGIKDKKEIKKVLSLVGLNSKNSKYKNFSLGMKQRLGIAMALLGNPEILILDEPVNGLDPQGIVDIRNLIKKLNDEGMTVVISSHILGELEHTATRFGILNEGTIVADITKEDLQKQKNNINITVAATDLEKAKKVLAQNHISIVSVTDENTSLEDYYFNHIGGQK